MGGVTECGICYVDVPDAELTKTVCGIHTYCRACDAAVRSRFETCPFCRQAFKAAQSWRTDLAVPLLSGMVIMPYFERILISQPNWRYMYEFVKRVLSVNVPPADEAVLTARVSALLAAARAYDSESRQLLSSIVSHSATIMSHPAANVTVQLSTYCGIGIGSHRVFRCVACQAYVVQLDEYNKELRYIGKFRTKYVVPLLHAVAAHRDHVFVRYVSAVLACDESHKRNRDVRVLVRNVRITRQVFGGCVLENAANSVI